MVPVRNVRMDLEEKSATKVCRVYIVLYWWCLKDCHDWWCGLLLLSKIAVMVLMDLVASLTAAYIVLMTTLATKWMEHVQNVTPDGTIIFAVHVSSVLFFFHNIIQKTCIKFDIFWLVISISCSWMQSPNQCFNSLMNHSINLDYVNV